jgi:hypothetical protein
VNKDQFSNERAFIIDNSFKHIGTRRSAMR